MVKTSGTAEAVPLFGTQHLLMHLCLGSLIIGQVVPFFWANAAKLIKIPLPVDKSLPPTSHSVLFPRLFAWEV